MAGLVPAIYVFGRRDGENVDARAKPGQHERVRIFVSEERRYCRRVRVQPLES